MTDELGWDHADKRHSRGRLQVSGQPRPRSAKALRGRSTFSLLELDGTYALVPPSGGHFRLTGTFEPQIEQSCVVTLEPLTATIAESFSVDFWPETEMPAPASGSSMCTTSPIWSPLLTGQIDVGRVIFECLAGCIDLFPRKSGVTFDSPVVPPTNGGASKSDSPFAALAGSRQR